MQNFENVAETVSKQDMAIRVNSPETEPLTEQNSSVELWQ